MPGEYALFDCAGWLPSDCLDSNHSLTVPVGSALSAWGASVQSGVHEVEGGELVKDESLICLPGDIGTWWVAAARNQVQFQGIPGKMAITVDLAAGPI